MSSCKYLMMKYKVFKML